MLGLRDILRPRVGCDSLKLRDPDSVAMGGRYQMKLDQYSVLIFDAFVGFPEDRATTYGLRTEWLLQF